MRSKFAFIALGSLVCFSMLAASLETKPQDPYFAKFQPLKGPKPSGLVLKTGDRLAICGDSITEQKMYSRLMETYITVALPELGVNTRQYGWGGEQASGFLGRMTNDVLRFKPTVATTCYGMNDHHYQPYKDSIGDAYRSNSLCIIKAFKSAGTRAIQGSPGCMGPKAPWAFIQGTAEERNLNLCALRNIGVEIANKEKVGFADVFWPMFQVEYSARQKLGSDYLVAGGDSVHPDWAGHVVMAYCFLKALGVPGDIGTFTVDLKSDKAKVSQGHELVSCSGGIVTIKSSRYPFCDSPYCDAKDHKDWKTARSGMTLVPFNQDLNRLMLVVKGEKGKNYRVTWGDQSKTFAAAQLKKGVNLAAEFPSNPFGEAFTRVDAAVKAKQDFETHQIKSLFHGAEGKADMEKTVAESEQEHARLVAAVNAAFVPVTHTIKIEAE